MGKISDDCNSKNSKLWLCLLIIIAFAVVFCFLGTVLYYKHSIVTCRVEYVSGENNVLVQTYSKGERVKFPQIPTKNGYNFIGWTMDKDAKFWVGDEIVVDKGMTLYAQWQKKTFEIKYNNNSYTIDYNCSFLIEDGCIIFIDEQGKVVKINNSYKDGYDFESWQLSDGIFTLNDFDVLSLDRFQGNQLILKENYVAKQATFQINEAKNYSISNLSHRENITIGEKLTFDLILDESVDKSTISVSSSNGVANKSKEDNVYKVEVTDFTRDFEVYIDNVDINEYTIVFNSDDEFVAKSVKYGETIDLPQFTKNGYNLIGFKDSENNIYTNSFVVTDDKILEAVFELKTYTIVFPKNNGKYLIKYEDQYLVNNSINKKFAENLNFELVLSNAYNQSNIDVYGIANGKRIDSTILDNKYSFDFISNDMIIYIDNITINTYNIIVDDVNYGLFNYGTFVSIVDDGLLIRDDSNGVVTKVSALYKNNLASWTLSNGEILTNAMIQDLTDTNTLVIIGNYIIRKN